MKIVGEVKTEDFLTIQDIGTGTVFVFIDNPSDIYIRSEDGECICLNDGEIASYNIEHYDMFPIKVVNAEVHILDD